MEKGYATSIHAQNKINLQCIKKIVLHGAVNRVFGAKIID